ncbi:hypothetical protein Aduo_001528 [Ancylostoma duodenale]
MWAYDTPVTLTQLVSNILAAMFGFSVHLYVAIRTIANCEKMSHNRRFVVAISAVYIVDLAIELLLNEIYGYEFISYGLQFLAFRPHSASFWFIHILRVTRELEVALLAIFNAYRTIVIIKPKIAFILCVVVTLIPMASYTTSLICWLIDSVELLYVSILMLPTNAVTTVICYVITRRYFKNSCTSEEVRKMQCRLSLGLLLQIVLQLTCNFIMWTYFLFTWFFTFMFDNGETALTVFLMYVRVLSHLSHRPLGIPTNPLLDDSAFFRTTAVRGLSLLGRSTIPPAPRKSEMALAVGSLS